MNDESEQHMICLAKRGDADAFGRLVQMHTRKVQRYLRRIIKVESDLEDVFQDTLFRAWKGMSSFRGDCSFSTWLTQIAHNTAINSLTKRGRDPLCLRVPEYEEGSEDAITRLGVDSSTPEDHLEARERAEKLSSELASMAEELRETLCMRQFDGLSYEAIAKKLCVPVGTVRSRIHRARAILDLLAK